MKTLVKSLFLVAVLLGTTVATFANDENDELESIADQSRMVVTTGEDAVLTLRLFNLDMQVTAVKIKDQSDNLIYFKKIKNNDEFAYRLNLTQLEDGVYSLYVNREQKKFVQPFTVNGNQVEIGALKEVIKPIVTVQDGSFTISQRGVLIENVSILTSKGKVIYSKNFEEDTKEVSKIRFKLEDDFSGKYTIRIQAEDEYYYEDLEVVK